MKFQHCFVVFSSCYGLWICFGIQSDLFNLFPLHHYYSNQEVIFTLLVIFFCLTLQGCFFFLLQEEKLKGKPGYEHLNEPLHILIEAELPANVIDTRLRQAQEVMEELLKPVVSSSSVQ